MTDGPRSLLDDAWAARVAGLHDDSLRIAMALVAADEGQLPAAALLFEELADAGRVALLDEAGRRLVDAFVRRGDLPRALAVCATLERAERDAGPSRKAIARAFGANGRQADVAPAPPPLPASAEVGDASGAALLDGAEAVLRLFLASEDPLPAAAPVPRLPLFGALPADQLDALLGAWELLELGAGEAAIEEGTEGRDAFVVVRGRLRAQRGGAQRGAEDAAVTLAELGPGAIFGEMALVSDAPRAASVVAAEPSQLLVAHRDALEKLAKKIPAIGTELASFCRARMVSNLIRHSAILRPLAPSERAALMERFVTERFKAGDHLVRRGDETEGLFLIASGQVRVVGEDADGETLQIAELGPGDVVGEIGLVLRRPATADVIATHPTVALQLKREDFQAAIKEHPGLLGELYDLATRREEETRSVVAQEALDVEDIVLL